jgi:3-mercaptopyruvate sulfurtransferase SseA
MRSYLILAAVVLVGASIFIGCNSADSKGSSGTTTSGGNQAGKSKTGPETTYADGARRITTGELAELMKNNEAFVVDVRNQASYDVGHIPGAKLIPSSEILNHVDELPANKLIVTYCS